MFSRSNLFEVKQQNSQIYAHVGRDLQRGTSSFVSSPQPVSPGRRSFQWVGGWQPIRFFWQRLSQRVRMRSQVSIQKMTNANKDCWWHVSDPRTGKSFYAETLSEAVDWIETHQLGK